MSKTAKKHATKVASKPTAKVLPFQLIQGTTNSGKPCFALMTDMELSGDDFKNLMSDIRMAGEGSFGFMKFYPERKTLLGRQRFISASGIDPQLFVDLAAAYQWNAPVPKEVKAAAKKAAKKAAPATGWQGMTVTVAKPTETEKAEAMQAIAALKAKFGI